MAEPLTSWRDGAAKQAILDFVSRAGGEGQDGVPVEERVATFDNDGTLWCEKPVPIQADFILRRLAEMAEPIRSCVSASPGKAHTSGTMPGSNRRSSSTMPVTTQTCGYSLAV
ncbi:MAG TPA: hypothetical protein VFR46_12095 [Actinomycetes bacterium]|nr:hypothetical protein [Actinomycetes bacterium]